MKRTADRRTKDPLGALRRTLVGVALALLVLAGLQPVLAQGATPGRVVVPFVSTPPVLDARADEWSEAPLLELRRREQLVDTGRVRWSGEEDAAASVRLLHDRSHLYLYVEVRDQERLAPAPFESWESGDVLELFFDCDLRDDGAGKEQFDADDLQLMLIPFGVERMWAAIDMLPLEREGRRRPVLADRGLTGIRIARALDDELCVLEVALPLHNLPQLAPGASVLGFNLAFGDRDASNGAYNYLVWANGVSPIDRTSCFGRLVFDGPAVLVPEDRGEAPFWRLLRSAAWIVLPGFVLLVLLVFARRTVRRLFARRRALARATTLLLASIVVGAWVLPGVWLDLHDAARFDAVRRLAGQFDERLPHFEDGGLVELRGESRDAPLVALLGGGTLQLPVAQDYVSVSRLESRAMGYVPERSDTLDAEFHIYGIPLTPEPQRFALPAVSAGDVFVGLFSQEPSDVAASVLLPVRLRFETGEGGEEVELRAAPDPELQRSALLRPRFAAEIEVPAGASGVSLACDQTGARLEGAALRRGGTSVPGTPIWLGSVARIGVPVALRGESPEFAGFLLQPGQSRRITLRQPEAGVSGVWLFLEGLEGPSFGASSDGLVVGRVQVEFARGGADRPGKRFELRHQRELFASDKSANAELERLGTEGHAAIAFEWEGRDGSARITPALQLEFERTGTLRELAFEISGPYGVRVREIVLVKPREAKAEPSPSSALRPTSRAGERVLRADWRRDFEGARYYVFRGRRLTAGPEDSTPGDLSLATDVAKKLQEQRIVVARNQLVDSGDSHEAFLALGSEAWGDAVLAISIPDPWRGELQRRLLRSSLGAGGIALALFIVFGSELLWGLFGLRWQLGSLFFVAGVLPLVLLSVFLVGLMEGEQRQQEEERILAAVQKLQGRIDEERGALEKGALALLQKLSGLVTEAPGAGADPRRLDRLQESLALARPRDWHPDSFLSVQLPPSSGEERSVRVWDRERSRGLGDRPLGAGSGLYLRWGSLVLGARAELGEEPGSGLRAAWGRVLDDEWLRGLALEGTVGLYGLDGHPLASTESEAMERSPERAEERRRVAEQLRASPGVRIERFDEGELRLGAFALLRDPTGKSVGLLGVTRQSQAPSLRLWADTIPLRRSFAIALVAMFVISLFLAWSLTERVSRPVERLEGLARAIAGGELRIRVPPVPGQDEIASLNRAFGRMADELRERVTELRRTNAAIRELGAELDQDKVAQKGTELFLNATGARAGVLLLLDRDNGELKLFGEEEGPRTISRHGALALLVFAASGPFELVPGRGPGLAGFPQLAPHARALVLPIRVKERVLGALLLGFPLQPERDLHFEHLQTLLQQLATATETARIYRLAIEDAVTGLSVRRYFRRRLSQELERSQRSGEAAALLRIEIHAAGTFRQAVGDEFFDHVLGRLGHELERNLPEHALAGRTGLGSFELLLPGIGGDEGRRQLRMLLGLLEGSAADAGAQLRFDGRLACFPEDGVSAAFLLEALDREGGRAVSDPVPITPVHVDGGIWAAPAMLELLDKIERVAPSPLPVLVIGETGVGKELVIDRLHAKSGRHEGPLVKVNCAAIPESLLESELFGHEAGAFTGAAERKKGLFESADGGTLFLDEIGELPYELQAKLLRVLQSGEFTRVGGSAPIRVDVRLLAATHRELGVLLEEGRFREDLFYRLQGVSLVVPPLRERKVEIPALVEYFRAEFGPEARRFSAGALDRLYRYSFPGNVRELRNVVLRALVLARGSFVEAEDLELGEGGLVGAAPRSAPARPAAVPMAPVGGAASVTGVAGGAGGAPVAADVGAGAARDEGLADGSSENGHEGRWPRLLELLRARGPGCSIRPRDYCSLLGVSRRTATRDLQRFCELGRLQAAGNRRSQRYVWTGASEEGSSRES